MIRLVGGVVFIAQRFISVDICTDVPSVVWGLAGTSGSTVMRSTTSGASGSWVTRSTGLSGGYSTITADPHNSSIAFVGGNTLFRTLNGGLSWQNVGSSITGASKV